MDALPRILDVSRNQGSITWPQIPDRYVGAMIGCTHWPTGEIDWEAADNVEGALDRGVIPGGYHRVNPIRNTPEREVAVFLHRLDRLHLLGPGRLIPALDVEPLEPGRDAEKAAGIDMSAWVRELFAAWVDMAPDPRVLWYTSGSFYARIYGGLTDIPSSVKLWVGHWSGAYSNPKNPNDDPALAEGWAGKPTYRGDAEHPALIHQYWNKGAVPGIGPNAETGKPIAVDLNCLMPGVSLADVMQ